MCLGWSKGRRPLDPPCAPPLGGSGSAPETWAPGPHSEAPPAPAAGEAARQPGAGSVRGQARQSPPRRSAGTQRPTQALSRRPPAQSPRLGAAGQCPPGRALPFSADPSRKPEARPEELGGARRQAERGKARPSLPGRRAPTAGGGVATPPPPHLILDSDSQAPRATPPIRDPHLTALGSHKSRKDCPPTKEGPQHSRRGS